MTSNSIYETYSASGFGGYSVPLSDEGHLGQFRTNHRALLPTELDAAILDVGCGAGHYLYWLRQLGYTNALGIDVSADAVGHCQAHGLSAEHVDDLGLFFHSRPHTYDCITMNDVVEHLRRDTLVETLIGARDALRPRGTLLVKTLNLASIGGLYLSCSDFTHTGGFTERSLRQVLVASGFSEVDMRRYNFPRGGAKRNAYLAAQRIWGVVHTLILFVELGRDLPEVRTKLMLGIGYA